jgi:trehalose 6-phosphate synthase/phosphatase
VSLAAEHGAWLRYYDEDRWVALGQGISGTWKRHARRIMEDYAARTPGARIEEKSASVVWHYRESPDDLGEWQALQLASVLESLLAQSPVEVVHGSRIVEVRQQGVDKGRAYMSVVHQRGPFDLVIAAGDDRTDEDLFARLGDHGFSVHVGSGSTKAKVAVASPAEMRALLNALAEKRAAA